LFNLARGLYRLRLIGLLVRERLNSHAALIRAALAGKYN
jgi:hypothetical protein